MQAIRTDHDTGNIRYLVKIQPIPKTTNRKQRIRITITRNNRGIQYVR